MKNLARVLSLVLVLSMLVSSVAFAGSFTDIEAGSIYEEATAVLSDLGIILGYEDGTFGPDKVITRAEVVAIVNRLQGLSDAAKAAGGATAYTDVAADAWYAGDVNLATQMGIISGDGNGLFRPEDQVKYEEAVKMMVAACGYTQEYALSRGGWPTGYLVIATEQGITKGLAETAGAPAYRGIVAKLAYQALTAPMMVLSNVQNITGIANYAPDEEEILLEKRLGTIKLSGYVSANSISALTGSVTDEGKINFVMNIAKVGKPMADFKFAENATSKTIQNILVGATDVADTIGVATDIYIKENAEGKYEVVAYVIQSARNNVVTIENTTDIQAFGADTNSSKWDEGVKYLSVYNADTDATKTTYPLAENAKVLLNGNNVGAISTLQATYINSFRHEALTTATVTELGLVYAPAVGTVELIDMDNDGYYDYIKVVSYETTVMTGDPFSNNTKIPTDVKTIDLNFENIKGASYSITLDGEEADIADLKKDDVLSIAKSGTYNWTILATRATVTGTVTELSNAGEMTEWEFVVGDKTYTVANLAVKANSKLSDINAGDEVIFYLDAAGNVAYAEKVSSSTDNYGFVVAAGLYESIGDVEYEVRIFGKDGSINTYVLAEKVKVTDAATGKNNTSVVAGDVYAEYIAAMPLLSKVSASEYKSAWVFDTDKTYYTAPDVEADEDDMIASYASRIITYAVSGNKITAITIAKSDATDFDNFTIGGTLAGDDYNEKTGLFTGICGVSEEAVIFNLPIDSGITAEDFKISTVSMLSEDKTSGYNGAYYSVDEDGNARALLITNDAATIGADQNLAVAVKVMAGTDANGEKVKNITFVQAGETKTIATTAELESAGVDLEPGDVFVYSVDEAGAIDEIALGLAYDEITDDHVLDSDDGVEYVFGAVYAKSSKTIALAEYDGTGSYESSAFGDLGRHVIPEDANVIVIDLSKTPKSNKFIQVGSIGDINATIWDRDTAKAEAGSDFAVFLKYNDGVVTDVIVYAEYANVRW